MKIAIMQPYFLPYIGYWQLIKAVDCFVVYDNIQYTKKGWINRNYFLQQGNKKLFTIPLQKDSAFSWVRDRVIAEDAGKMINRSISQIEQSYKRAGNFAEAFPVIKRIFLNTNRNLFDYIYSSIMEIAQYLNLQTKLIIS
jgi:hypothetical protein